MDEVEPVLHKRTSLDAMLRSIMTHRLKESVCDQPVHILNFYPLKVNISAIASIQANDL